MAPTGLGRALWVQLSPAGCHSGPAPSGTPYTATRRGSELDKRPGPGDNTEHVQLSEEVLAVLPCTPAPVQGDSGCKTGLLGRCLDTGTRHRLGRHRETPGNAAGWKGLRVRSVPSETATLPASPLCGGQLEGGPPFPLGPVPRRQRAGGGGRSSELQPTGPLTSASHCPHDPPHERHAGRRTRASGAQAGNAGRRALPELSKPSCASGPCRQQPAPRRAQRDRGDTSLPLRPLDPDPGYGGGHTCPWWGRPPPDLGPRVWPMTPVRISSTPTSGAWGAGARPGWGAARGRRGWPQAGNWVLLNRTHPARSREGCARPLPGLLGGQSFCHSGQRLTC